MKKSICIIIGFILIFFNDRFLNIHVRASDSDQAYSIFYSEEGKLESPFENNTIFPEFSEVNPGDTFSLTLNMENQYKGEYDYIGFYIKTQTDDYDPECGLSPYNKRKNDIDRITNEIKSLDPESEEYNKKYETLLSLEELNSRRPFSFNDGEETDDNCVLLTHALNCLDVSLQLNNKNENSLSDMTLTDPLRPTLLARFNEVGVKVCTIEIHVPDNIASDDIERLRAVRWILYACQRYETQNVQIDYKILNLPENGLYVPVVRDDNGRVVYELDENGNEIYPENDHVEFEVFIINAGNTMFDLIQIRAVDSSEKEYYWYTKEGFPANSSIPIDLILNQDISYQDAEKGEGEIHVFFEGLTNNPDINERYVKEIIIPYEVEDIDEEKTDTIETDGQSGDLTVEDTTSEISDKTDEKTIQRSDPEESYTEDDDKENSSVETGKNVIPMIITVAVMMTVIVWIILSNRGGK